MRPAIVLTDAAAARAAPRPAEYTLRDARCPGFGLRVRTCGARTWVLRVKVDGASKRIVIGAADAMSAEEARARAFALLAGEAGAPRSSTLAKAPPPAPRFSKVAEAFLAAKADAWRPSSLTGARKYLRSQLLPAFGATPINRLTTPQVAEWFHGYSRTRPGGANTALGHARTASTERYAHLEGGYLMEAADRCAARVAALLG